MPEALSPEAMLARLVAFPTVSRDTNLPLCDFVRDWLGGHGIAVEVRPSPCGRKANLLVEIGPPVPGGVVLSGHTDVVPVEGQAWTSDPFRLTEREGRLLGRGTSDMKGFVALCLALAPEMAAAGLKRPVQIALSYDEEVGHLGVPHLIAALKDRPRAAAALIGEPTGMRVVTEHKGGALLRTHVRGFEVHSGHLHRGVSAVTNAARLVLWHAERTAANMAAAIAAGPAAPGARFDPPCTTLHNGMIEGGTAANITAKDCRFTSDIRVLPSEDRADWIARYRAFAAEVAREMAAVRPEAGIDIEVVVSNPGLARDPGGAAETLALRLAGEAETFAVPFGTEAANFREAGWSACVIGPGSIARAHQPDEYITRDELASGAAFLRRMIAELAA